MDLVDRKSLFFSLNFPKKKGTTTIFLFHPALNYYLLNKIKYQPLKNNLFFLFFKLVLILIPSMAKDDQIELESENLFLLLKLSQGQLKIGQVQQVQ